VPERTTQGIHINEIPSADQPIARLVTGVTAFVGRALRGPINRPVRLASFADYHSVFGGLWQPSTLSYAVEQFFEHGGRTAVVVRVMNGGAPVTLSLPCDGESLTLEAIAPGTREFLRASVDYDNIGENEEDRFNLVIQRVRSPGSERIEDQEIFRRISMSSDTQQFVGRVLLDSQLVRVRGPVPARRPERSLVPGRRHAVGYVDSNPDGDDGGTLSDYDIIGSARAGTGLFALQSVEEFDTVCIPPLARDRDVGAGTLLVAARLCRERRACLVVDPRSDWTTPQIAIESLQALNFASENSVMFFPRIMATDRLRGRLETFANCGAVAGMLARRDDARPEWDLGAQEPDLLLRPGTRAASVLSEGERWRLATHGINALQSVRSHAPVRLLLRTLAGGSNAAADWGYLRPRRLALCIARCVEYGTRWVVTEQSDRSVWRRVTAQVERFLAELAAEGAFPAAPSGEASFVICDERVNAGHDVAQGRVNFVVGFAALRAGQYHSFLVSHSAVASTVRWVGVNRLQPSSESDPRLAVDAMLAELRAAEKQKRAGES
jgi:Bacteriophage tail sheath protein